MQASSQKLAYERFCLLLCPMLRSALMTASAKAAKLTNRQLRADRVNS